MTLAAYPLVPKDEVGFRVQLTAANTDAEVDALIAAIEELAEAASCVAATARRAMRGRTGADGPTMSAGRARPLHRRCGSSTSPSARSCTALYVLGAAVQGQRAA